MASPAWRGLWRALARCGHPRYTTQPPPRLTPWKTAGVADGPGGHLAVQRHAISRTFDLIRATHTEESTTRLPTDSRYTHHRPSWVHPHPRSRSFSATSNSLLQHVKADANSDLTVASPGDGGDGLGDMAMFNRFASAQPLALVAQGIANVSGDSPLDYPLVKAEDNGFTEGIMCYLLKAGADQIVPHTVIFWLLHLRVQSLKVIGDFHMLNTSNCQEWNMLVPPSNKKLVEPAIEATKFYTKNRMIRLIPQIIKIGFAAIHLMYSADPEEVNCWQIRYLTKAPQAAGVIHFDFERCFICVELPPDLGLLLDAFTRTNEPDSIYGIMMIKEVYAYLDLTQTCGRKMLPKMWSSCYILPQLQIGRFFSRRKIKCVDEFSLKAKNSSILCLDGSFPEVRSSLRKVIAQLRQFCYDHGQRIDVSSIYGPGKVVYTPPGIGTFDLKVLHCKKWISFPILASDLYFPGFRSENGLFVLRQLSNFTCDEGYYMLGFTGSYTVAYQVTSVDDILKQIRILSRVHLDGVFAQEAADSVLTLPKECAMGKEVEHPYVLLEEWDTGKCL